MAEFENAIKVYALACDEIRRIEKELAGDEMKRAAQEVARRCASKIDIFVELILPRRLQSATSSVIERVGAANKTLTDPIAVALLVALGAHMQELEDSFLSSDQNQVLSALAPRMQAELARFIEGRASNIEKNAELLVQIDRQLMEHGKELSRMLSAASSQAMDEGMHVALRTRGFNHECQLLGISGEAKTSLFLAVNNVNEFMEISSSFIPDAECDKHVSEV